MTSLKHKVKNSEYETIVIECISIQLEYNNKVKRFQFTFVKSQ